MWEFAKVTPIMYILAIWSPSDNLGQSKWNRHPSRHFNYGKMACFCLHAASSLILFFFFFGGGGGYVTFITVQDCSLPQIPCRSVPRASD